MAMVSYVKLGKNIEAATRRATMRYVRRVLHCELKTLQAEFAKWESIGEGICFYESRGRITEVKALIVQFGGRV